MKRSSAKSSGGKAGRPFGETSYSGKGMMTKYTKPTSSGGMSMKVDGKKASANGAKNLAGRAGSKTYVHDPNLKHKPN